MNNFLCKLCPRVLAGEKVDLWDFEIVCGDTTYYCHKLVLASHSIFFKTMFATNNKRQDTDKFNADNVFDYKSIECLIQICYSSQDPLLTVAPNRVGEDSALKKMVRIVSYFGIESLFSSIKAILKARMRNCMKICDEKRLLRWLKIMETHAEFTDNCFLCGVAHWLMERRLELLENTNKMELGQDMINLAKKYSTIPKKTK